MDCHIEIHHEGAWRHAAVASFPEQVRLGFRASGCVFEYEFDYAFTAGMPVLSLAFPVDASRHRLAGWPAFLVDLVPQGNGRRFLLGQLGLADGEAADLPLLLAGAFNPIGRLRVREAVDYFGGHVARHELPAQGFDFDELLGRAPDFHEAMMVYGMLATGGTGVQGVAPKYLLTRATDGRWHPDMALSDDLAVEHFIVKRPRGPHEADRKVLHNEARYMQVAQRLGVRTFRLPQLHGDLLFIPRFDRLVRQGRVVRLHQESLASVAGLTGFGMQTSQFALLAALRRVVDYPLTETIEFIKRDVLNLAMRNTDNHARNTALQVVDGVTRLAPLFDFAPMYLDPEGIARASRWYHPEAKRELREWSEVLAHLGLPPHEHRQLVEELVEFGQRLGTLGECLREARVDTDIIDFLQPGIAAQIRQLLALR